MAAFIIVGMLISAKVVYNVANSPEESSQVMDLSKEINFESVKVIDNRIFSNNKENLYDNVEALSEIYSNLNPNTDLAFIVGNSEEFRVFFHKSTYQGSAGVSTGGSDAEIEIQEQVNGQGTIYPLEDGKIRYRLDDKTVRTFDVKKGQNFYIVLKNEKEGEKIVVSN